MTSAVTLPDRVTADDGAPPGHLAPPSTDPNPPAETFGDRLNPILVKETRQALKSRQFIITFSVLLVAALGWTVVGTLSLMPQVYTTPSAPRLLIGYYLVLAVPMMIIVPLTAFRSLETEIDDGTLELLSITTLLPRQVVRGKLHSAMLQMMLYFVVLFPCVAYAYTLRGVDLPTVAILLTLLPATGIFLSSFALFMASLQRGRTGRIVTLLTTLGLLVTSLAATSSAVIPLITGDLVVGDSETVYTLTLLAVAAVMTTVLLLSAAAAQLTPPTENRSTTLRLAMLGALTAVIATLAAAPLRRDFRALWTDDLYGGVAIAVVVLWIVAASLMAAESAILTPRIRRELPASVAARATLNLLTPGPATGALLGVMTLWAAIVALLAIYQASGMPGVAAFSVYGNDPLPRVLLGVGVYGTIGIAAVRVLVAVVRRRNATRVEIGLAALIVCVVLTSLLPYGVGLHLNDYIPFSHNLWQTPNSLWTLYELSAVVPPASAFRSLALAAGVALASAAGLLFSSPRLAFPRRIATPKRVVDERRRGRAAPTVAGVGSVGGRS